MKRIRTEYENLKNTYLKDGLYTSIKDIVLRVGKYNPDLILFGEIDDKNGDIVYYNAKDCLNNISYFSNGLRELGITNKHMAIILKNSYLYVMLDTALSSDGNCVIPIGYDNEEELLKTMFIASDANYIICDYYTMNRIINKIDLNDITTFEGFIIVCENGSEIKCEKDVILINEIMEAGKKASFDYYKHEKVDLEKIAKILFTSGTTGPNKPVMLTQRNLVNNAINCLNVIQGEVNNTSMSVLPMHHGAELNTHIFARYAAGRLTFICKDMSLMMRDMKIFKPNVITVVPLIAKAIYNNIILNAKKEGKLDKLNKGIKLCNLFRRFGIDISHKLFKDIYNAFGGNLNQIVCGGAMLNKEVSKGLCELGIRVSNGYGISECGPLVSMNNDGFNYPDSIGKICPGLEYKIFDYDEEGAGELCVKGPSVSKGYYKDREATLKVFDSDGFFHTGDIVKEDRKGYLYIVGRKKNVIILENGKNVCPEELEALIEKNINYLDDYVVYQHNRMINGKEKEFIVCGIWVNRTKEELKDLNDEELKEKIKNSFKELNNNLPQYKRINYISISSISYPRTALRKIKRDILNEYHNEEGIIL
ncbi:MAG: AMP-binding protein [Bacilli bacterium]|nr:AMP-binding protein [Bacilli bacterium]